MFILTKKSKLENSNWPLFIVKNGTTNIFSFLIHLEYYLEASKVLIQTFLIEIDKLVATFPIVKLNPPKANLLIRIQ